MMKQEKKRRYSTLLSVKNSFKRILKRLMIKASFSHVNKTGGIKESNGNKNKRKY